MLTLTPGRDFSEDCNPSKLQTSAVTWYTTEYCPGSSVIDRQLRTLPQAWIKDSYSSRTKDSLHSVMLATNRALATWTMELGRTSAPHVQQLPLQGLTIALRRLELRVRSGSSVLESDAGTSNRGARAGPDKGRQIEPSKVEGED